MVRIGHDGKGLGAGWYLDEVTVEVPSRGELMMFPCHRWLAEDEDDGKIERELYPSQQNNIEQSKIYFCYRYQYSVTVFMALYFS
jgi:hypothetical protein